MDGVLQGVRVLEMASHVYVPSACSLLGEWGAEVIKVEAPGRGDPLRDFEQDPDDPGSSTARYLFEVSNRNKRSIVIDASTVEGRAAIYKLVGHSDAFVTNFREPALVKLGLDCDSIRRHRSDIVYARGTGNGSRGPDADKPAYDGTSFWSRSGFIDSLTPPSATELLQVPRASGDLISGIAMALGVVGALFKRQRTGTSVVVESSLLNTALWAIAFEATLAANTGATTTRRADRASTPNPLAISYRSRDGRYIKLSLHDSQRYWRDLCAHIGCPELAEQPRFATAQERDENSAACVAALEEVFSTRDLAHWQQALEDFDGPWDSVQSSFEATGDHQVQANHYLQSTVSGRSQTLVSGPVQFDGAAAPLASAPRLGEHTSEIARQFDLDLPRTRSQTGNP